MKVRFLHNRKTSVINTVQIFIGLNWQYAASSLPFLIGTECPRANTIDSSKQRGSRSADMRDIDTLSPQNLSPSQAKKAQCGKFPVISGSLPDSLVYAI